MEKIDIDWFPEMTVRPQASSGPDMFRAAPPPFFAILSARIMSKP